MQENRKPTYSPRLNTEVSGIRFINSCSPSHGFVAPSTISSLRAHVHIYRWTNTVVRKNIYSFQMSRGMKATFSLPFERRQGVKPLQPDVTNIRKTKYFVFTTYVFLIFFEPLHSMRRSFENHSVLGYIEPLVEPLAEDPEKILKQEYSDILGQIRAATFVYIFPLGYQRSPPFLQYL